MKGFMYILRCSNGCFYTGSTINIDKRLKEHQAGEGSNYTKKHIPVELVYYEEFQDIKHAFNREKQFQGWNRSKKLALIKNKEYNLLKLSNCQNSTHYSLFDKCGSLSGVETPR